MDFTLSIIVAILIFLFGVLIKKYFYLCGEKRKEWNTLVEPIRITLFNEGRNHTPYTKGIDDIDIFKLRGRLPWFKRFGFDSAIKKYKESKSKKNTITKPPGEVYFIDAEKVSHSIKNLIKYTKLK